VPECREKKLLSCSEKPELEVKLLQVIVVPTQQQHAGGVKWNIMTSGEKRREKRKHAVLHQVTFCLMQAQSGGEVFPTSEHTSNEGFNNLTILFNVDSHAGIHHRHQLKTHNLNFVFNRIHLSSSSQH